MKMLKSLETLLSKAKECIIANSKEKRETPLHPPKQSPKKPPPVDDDMFQFQHQPNLGEELLSEVFRHLKTLEYHPNSRNPLSPEIHLFGSQRYCYNTQSAAVYPTPITAGNTMSALLGAVNDKLGTSYNSMLINKYRNLNCFLGAHKDDEECIDPSAPISTLSFGATRRMQIAQDEAKHTPVKVLTLTPRSLFTMMPGFQNKYWHSIAPGRRSVNKEKGVRYSITFRQLFPRTEELIHDSVSDKDVPVQQPISAEPTPAPSQLVPASEVKSEEISVSPSAACPDTLVFGSSLTKGLDEDLLSKYSSNFRVFTHRGAQVKDIYEDVEEVIRKEDDTRKVKTIFFLCGGNDIQNLKRDDDIKFVYEDLEDLISLTSEAFPNAKINILSLIPRRSVYRRHIENMHTFNRWLSDFCNKEAIRFVNIFSFFLNKTPTIWYLNKKLFNGSKLHFNSKGDSVLAKVLIGVANIPR